MEIDTRTLLKLGEERAQDNKLIVVFANSQYLEVLLNWLVAIKRLGIRNYLIISLDKDIHCFLAERGFASFLAPLAGPLSQLWMMRLQIFRALCRNGIDFIHSDADAVWLRNPIPDYFSDPTRHIVASQGTIWPPDIVKTQGFVFCCGLFYVRSCDATRALLDDMVNDVTVSGDDQVSLNRILQSRGIHWGTAQSHSYPLVHEGQQFLCFKHTVTGYSADGTLTVALLPHHLFQRLHMPGQNAFVKHLLCDKTSGSKLDMFEQTDSRFLRPDWNHAGFKEHSLDRLDARSSRNKKIFVYGLQSSGASLFTYFLAQKPGSLGIVDLNNHRLSPPLNAGHDTALKAVVTTTWPLQDHLNSFQPDKTILFLRNPYNNYYSLMHKAYANKSGAIDDKFRLLEKLFRNRDKYDLTIFYEDFISDADGTVYKLNSLGWESTNEHYRFPRPPQDIARFNVEQCTWCRENPAAPGPSGGWGMGNIRSSRINLTLSDKPFDPAIDRKIKELCPTLYAYYRDHPHLHSQQGSEPSQAEQSA
jgi:hypothetical protein